MNYKLITNNMSQEDNLEIVTKEVSPVVEQATALIIATGEDMTLATETLSKLNALNDRVVEDREKITKPLNAALKEVRAKYKPIESQLEEAIGIVRGKMSKYQTAALKAKSDEEARISARIGEGRGKLKIETAVAQIEAIETPEAKVETEAGAVVFIPTKKFEIVSLAELPIEYHVADEIAIRKKMKEGVELPGVRYWIEQVPRNNR